MTQPIGFTTAIIAGSLAFGAYVPYARDIVKGKVRPARAARIMFSLLLVVALLQQRSLGAGWTLAVTLGEGIGTLAILGLAIKYGAGGLSRVDRLCYALLIVDVVFWLTTGNAFLALVLSIAADTIAFFPTLYKTWLNPRSETATFYVAGAAAPLINLVGAGHLTYQIALYPLYLAVANGVEIALIWQGRIRA